MQDILEKDIKLIFFDFEMIIQRILPRMMASQKEMMASRYAQRRLQLPIENGPASLPQTVFTSSFAQPEG